MSGDRSLPGPPVGVGGAARPLDCRLAINLTRRRRCLHPNEIKWHRRAKISLSPRDHRHSREVTRLRAQLRASDSSELMKALSIVKKLVEPGGREEALQGSRLVKFRLTTL